MITLGSECSRFQVAAQIRLRSARSATLLNSWGTT